MRDGLEFYLEIKSFFRQKASFPWLGGTIGREELGARGHHGNRPPSVCLLAFHLSPPDPQPAIHVSTFSTYLPSRNRLRHYLVWLTQAGERQRLTRRGTTGGLSP